MNVLMKTFSLENAAYVCALLETCRFGQKKSVRKFLRHKMEIIVRESIVKTLIFRLGKLGFKTLVF